MSNGDQTSRFARLYFRRHFFQHVGFRLARSLTNEPTPVRLCQADHVYANQFYNGEKKTIIVLYALLLPYMTRIFKDTPVAILGADLDKSYIPPLNPQFEFDKATVCDRIVTENGQVS